MAMKEPHAQVLVRVPVALHKEVSKLANEMGVSISNYCVKALERDLLRQKVMKGALVVDDPIFGTVVVNQLRKIGERNYTGVIEVNGVTLECEVRPTETGNLVVHSSRRQE